MGQPVVLVENFFSGIQYPDHTISAEEEASGHPVERLANGRRSTDDYWTATTTNSSTWVKVQCDRVRAANMLVLDRGHNLAGKTITIECSQDNFTTTHTIKSAITIPASSSPGAVTDTSGVLTEEGAWVIQFDLRAALYWRVTIPAMGSGLKPNIVGLWLGLALTLDWPDLPLDDDADELIVDLTQSDAGWIGNSQAANRRKGGLVLKLNGHAAYDAVRLMLQGHYGMGRPCWLLHDSEQADRALLVRRPSNDQGFRFDTGWGWRQGTLDYIEHEPRWP